MVGLVLTVLMCLVTLLAVLVHMRERHGIAVHWKCSKEEEGPVQDWEWR